MITEYEDEPVPGLPGHLPPDETLLWQGSPDRRMLARTAFHTRAVAGYFALLAGVALVNALVSGGGLFGVGATLVVGSLGVGLLELLAWASARSTIYTLTERRIVMRFGIALPTCINLPLSLVGSVDLSEHGGGTGDLPLSLTGKQRLGYLGLWPHARPWRMSRPEPMLRAVPDAKSVAALIARTCLAANPQGRIAIPAATGNATPDFAGAVAA